MKGEKWKKIRNFALVLKHDRNNMLKLSELQLVSSRKALNDIPEGKVLINTINAHSYNVAQNDDLFA